MEEDFSKKELEVKGIEHYAFYCFKTGVRPNWTALPQKSKEEYIQAAAEAAPHVAAPDETRSKFLLLAIAEILESTRDLVFMSLSPVSEYSTSKIAGAVMGIARALDRLVNVVQK